MKNLLIGCLVVLIISGSALAGLAEVDILDAYGGWTGLKGTKTGWFHTEEINGRWWIITPEGNVFWLLGVYCVRFGGIPETGTGKRAYKEACQKKYGSEAEWARVAKKQIKDWGFNTIGDWSSETIYGEGFNRKVGMSYVIGIDLPRKAENVIPEGYWGYFPDVFSEEFKESAKEAMEKKFKRQPYLIRDPWLIGYFLADDTPWFGSKQRHEGLVDDYIALDSDKPGKKAWINFIRSSYSGIDTLNKSWQANFKNLEDVFSLRKVENNENILKDKLSFLKIIALEFTKVLAETLRDFDKNHMILGTRPTKIYPEVIEAIGRYSDVYTMSYYSLNKGYKIDPKFSETVDTIYKYSKKPIILGASVSAQDTKLPYGIVRTQKDRGISYWRYLARLASNPVIVGGQWFQYFDPPLKCYDNHPENWGLVNENDDVYQDAVNLIKEANKMAYTYALGLSEFVPEFDSLLGAKTQLPTPQGVSLTQINIPIINAGFEEGSNGWKLQAWKGESKVLIDSSIRRSGRKSLKIQGGGDKGWDSVGVGVQNKPKFVLKPGFDYKLSCWIKTKEAEDFAFIRIKGRYKNGNAMEFRTAHIYGNQDWKQIEVEFTPLEENTVDYLGVQFVGRGIAWFDDIKLEVGAPGGYKPGNFISVDDK